MTNDPQRSTYKLVVFNPRGRVLGTVIRTDNDGAQTAVCNDCDERFYARFDLSACIEWIETHEHFADDQVQPSTSVERELPELDARPSELAMAALDRDDDELVAAAQTSLDASVAANTTDERGGLALYHVVCPDDQIRHELPFIRADDATTFADTGHACMSLAHHRLTRWCAQQIEIRSMAPGSEWAPLDDVLTVITLAETVQ